MNFKKLYDEARKIDSSTKVNRYASYGGVGAALMTKKGSIYTGICIDTCCGLGFCAEHSAIADMLKHKESEIKEIVAVKESGGHKVISPCGRCRELMLQINPKNKDTVIHLSSTKRVKLSKLLPEHWIEQI